jgi:hypothetical protein
LPNVHESEEKATQQTVYDESTQENPPHSDTAGSDDVSSTDAGVVQSVFRFRRPVISDDTAPGMTDSYETLTLSEVQQLDGQWDADVQLQLEELQLALGDFDEGDEFEEVDEFDDDWEEGVGVDGDWDVEADCYCDPGECGEEFLDDRD